MKQGPFEITLFDPSNDTDYEERVVDGKVHFVAVLGREFKVRVKFDNSCGLYPRDSHMRLDLALDGVKIYHCTLTNFARHFGVYVFHGYWNVFDYRAFEFRGQSFTYDALKSNPDSKVGFITVTISTAVITHTEEKENGLHHRVNGQHSEAQFKRKATKQLWSQPSASIGIGRTIMTNDRPIVYSKIVDTLATITVPYHTAEVLDKWQQTIDSNNASEVIVVPAPEQTVMQKRARKEENTALDVEKRVKEVIKIETIQIDDDARAVKEVIDLCNDETFVHVEA